MSFSVDVDKVKNDKLSDFIQNHFHRFDYLAVYALDMNKIPRDTSFNTLTSWYCGQVRAENLRKNFEILTGTAGKTQTFSQQEMMRVASRFFYCDQIGEDLTIGYHICVGINGVDELKRDRDYLLLEAFCYEAIFQKLMRSRPQFEKRFRNYIGDGLDIEKAKKTDKTMILQNVKEYCYNKMEKEPSLKEVLLKHYEKHKEDIGFIIQ